MLCLEFPNAPNIFMYKFLLVSLIFLSSCSYSWNQETINDTTSQEERSQSIVYNILWPFEIDPEKDSLTVPLVDIQDTCDKEDFLWYRKCFLDKFIKQHDAIIHTSKQEEFFKLFSDSLRKEIEYYPYYEKLVNLEYPSRDRFSSEGKCYIVGTWSFQTEYAWVLSESVTNIQLSYNENDKANLVRVFPSWNDAVVCDTMSFMGNYYDPNNPCLFRTFWPGYGNIIFTELSWDSLFVFLKVNEWAGSGEFNYSVFVFDTISRKYTNIGNFWSWGGIIPFEDNLNLEKEKKSLFEVYKNQPFLYYPIFENRRVYGDTVENIFVKYMK